MNVDEVIKELQKLGNEDTKKVLVRHGAREPFFGVKIGDLKKILKKTGHDHELALALYETGNSDAMYLAGLMAEPARFTRSVLDRWVKKAYWYMLSEYTVAGVAAESPHGPAMAGKWIKSREEMTAAAGWSTYSGVIAIRENRELDLDEISRLLDVIRESIHSAPNRVRYAMNNFIISAGAYIPDLREKAVAAATDIGKLSVDMGETACKVPYAPDYIKKMIDRESAGKKRRSIRC